MGWKRPLNSFTPVYRRYYKPIADIFFTDCKTIVYIYIRMFYGEKTCSYTYVGCNFFAALQKWKDMKLRLLLMFVLFNSEMVVAQSDTMLSNEASNLVYLSEKFPLFDSFNLKLDSIYVNVKFNSSRIITNNFFKNTGRSISIEYFYINDSIRYIKTSEKNFSRPDLDYFSHYYLQNDTLLEDDHGSSRSVQLGMSYTLDELKKIHSFPNRIEYVFLNKYVFILLTKLKSEIKSRKK